MKAPIASALAQLVRDYATQATLTGDAEHRRTIRDAYTQLSRIQADYRGGRVDDDTAKAWLDVGRYTLARIRQGHYLDEALYRVRTSRRL